jgi:hypothetical protein
VRARHLTPVPLARAVVAAAMVVAATVGAGACAGRPQPHPPAPGPPVGEATSSSGTGALGAPQPPEASATTRPPVVWRVGARPLPLRPDGFGQVLPTPAPLRVRRLPTVDRLPPPPGGRFRSVIRPIGPAVRARMGATWKPGCPVALADLRYLTVSFRGFDGLAHTGELVVNRRVAAAVVSVFARLYRARFPIEETYGLAVDLDPFQNPYRRGDLVLPELASAYLDRDQRRPGMIRPGDAATAAFAAVGWSWGGSWRSPRDLMHFSATGG